MQPRIGFPDIVKAFWQHNSTRGCSHPYESDVTHPPRINQSTTLNKRVAIEETYVLIVSVTYLLIYSATLSLWEKTSGTWINVITILGGTLIGVVLTGSLPTRMHRIITQGLGLLTLFLGVTLADSLLKVKAGLIDGVIIGLLAIVLGGLLGEWWRIEAQLHTIGNWLRDLVKGGGNFTEGLVAASLLFCIGPLAILGSLNNGLSGDHALLSIKSAMDGLASIALSSSYGIGVGFSSIAILLYQGGLSLCAGFLAQVLPDPVNAPQVLLTSGVGGLIIMGLGLNLLEVTQLSIAAFLPALLLAPIFCTIAQRLG